jgi:hypothetical protein
LGKRIVVINPLNTLINLSDNAVFTGSLGAGAGVLRICRSASGALVETTCCFGSATAVKAAVDGRVACTATVPATDAPVDLYESVVSDELRSRKRFDPAKRECPGRASVVGSPLGGGEASGGVSFLVSLVFSEFVGVTESCGAVVAFSDHAVGAGRSPSASSTAVLPLGGGEASGGVSFLVSLVLSEFVVVTESCGAVVVSDFGATRGSPALVSSASAPLKLERLSFGVLPDGDAGGASPFGGPMMARLGLGPDAGADAADSPTPSDRSVFLGASASLLELVEESPFGVAPAIPVDAATAVPMPSAKASAPTRPKCCANTAVRSCGRG